MLRWLKLSVVALVGCGFLGMILYALWMRDEIKSAQLEPPLISAPELALKRRPEEPGGMEIPNRDKLVFDLLDNSASATVPAPAPVDAEMAEGTARALETAAVPAETTSTAIPASNVARTSDQLAMARMAAGAFEEAATETSATTAVPVLATPTTVAVQAASEVKSEETAPPKQPAQTPAAAGGAWGIQLAAVGSQEDAVAAARRLQGQHAALKGLTPRTSRVVSGSGARYRVQFFGITSRAAATQVCDQLGDKQPCFPVGG